MSADLVGLHQEFVRLTWELANERAWRQSSVTNAERVETALTETREKLATAERRVQKLLEQSNDQHRQVNELCAKRNDAEARLAALTKEASGFAEDYQKFKTLVHAELDKMGVPEFDSEECRVSHRLKWLQARIAALSEENERLRLRLLSAAGDDLCRLSQEEIRQYTSGEVQIPPKEEFIPSCERFHAQISASAGVLKGCLTLAQLIAENEKQRRRIEELEAELALEKHDRRNRN